jgi:hypothetical protein
MLIGMQFSDRAAAMRGVGGKHWWMWPKEERRGGGGMFITGESE